MNEDLAKIYDKLDSIDCRLVAIETKVGISSKIAGWGLPVFLSLVGYLYIHNVEETKQINSNIATLYQNYAILKEDIILVRRD